MKQKVDVRLLGLASLLVLALLAFSIPARAEARVRATPVATEGVVRVVEAGLQGGLDTELPAATPDETDASNVRSASVLGVAAIGFGVLLVLLFLNWLGARTLLARSARNRILFDENPEPTILTTATWKITAANKAACALLGYTKDQITLYALDKLIESKAELEPEVIAETMRSGKALSFEAAIRREDEGDPPVELAATTRNVEIGHKSYWLTSFHDVTRQKYDQRLFHGFHRSLVEHLPIEVTVLGPQGQYLYNNPKAIPNEELREMLMGETDIEYCKVVGLHPEVALRRLSHRRRAVSTRSTVTFEEVIPNKERGYRTITRIYNPVIDPQGRVSAVVVYGVETTELKRYQEQMAAVSAEAERVADLKEAFLANISHEFRTPLTGILGFAQILQEDVGPGEREFVDIILRNGRRLMSTLNAMVDLSKLHSNYLQMNPTVFNLVDEVKQVAQSLSGLAQQKELYLRMRATRPEVLVRLDRTSLFRVLENLIGNAIKFTHTGGVIVEVHGDTEHVYVRVMDSGVGIRNEFLPFLFEEFNQESSGLSRNFEGTGIGLAIVKRLIDLMDGIITVDSEKGEGSMFTLTFPAAFPQTKDGKPARTRILVADQNEEVHTLVQYVLAPYFDVEYATDFATAMQHARQTQYDVVLLDAEFDNAPSAAEALVPIRQLEGYESVPVVALDPHAEHGGEVHFLAVGYDDCLHKPLDKRLLLDSLGHVLSPERKRGPAHLRKLAS